MDISGTGATLWPLTTGNNDNPTLTQGKPTSFFLNTVPDRCPTAPLAYYLPVVYVTFYATLTQPASGANVIQYDALISSILQSVQWQQAFHGTVVSSNHVLGVDLPVIEYYANGYRYATRRRPPIPTTAGATNIEYTVAITPSVSRLGRLMGDTAPMAAMLQTSQLQLNITPGTGTGSINALSPGATLTNITCRASAALVPRNELVLGTPVETILHQVVSGTNSTQVQINGFGTTTQLTGVQNKGGVVHLGELTNALGPNNLQGGVFSADNATQLNFPWRGQSQTNHMEAIVAANWLSAMPNSRPQVFPAQVTGGDSEFNDPPYVMGTNDDASSATGLDLKTAYAFWLVQGGNDCTLANLQTANSDQSYFLTVTGGFSAGTHQILAFYARAFTQNMVNDWVTLITRGGSNSLAAYVLGGTSALSAAKLRQRAPKTAHILTADNLAYLPWQLA